MGFNGWQRIETPNIIKALAKEDKPSKVYLKGEVAVIFSDDDQYEGENSDKWRHVSLSCRKRLPTWEEILDVRYSFFPKNAHVIQIFPPSKDYINIHPNCFHLWQNKSRSIIPDNLKYAVGILNEENKCS